MLRVALPPNPCLVGIILVFEAHFGPRFIFHHPSASEPREDTFLGHDTTDLVTLLMPTKAWHKRKFEVGLNELVFVGWPVFGKGEDAFNVVFVLNPPPLEYSIRVKEMYEHVIKKFSKALKLEQSRSGYVSEQAAIILKEKAYAAENGKSTPSSDEADIVGLPDTLQQKSSLAASIVTVYESISRSLIASVTLPSSALSLQIPPLTSTATLPTINDAATQPGVWLTTATAQEAGTPLSLAKNFTLLLLDDERKILSDISGPLGPFLTQYIRVSSPTKSFAKLSAAHSISLSDIQVLAQHLVSWRRARAIPPLHQRDVYIVSPNADMAKLPSAVKAYESTFPTLPSLPKMLQALSGTPHPYSSLIPSKDHKAAYFTILSWLLRGGWVTQLRSFGFIRAGHEVKGDDRKDSIILQPARASPAESKWLKHIGSHLGDHLSAEDTQALQKHWPAFIKYFNGSEAFEKIPVREGLKRKEVWDMLTNLGLFSKERRILIGFRHW